MLVFDFQNLPVLELNLNYREVVLLLLLVDALQNDITNMRLDDWQGPPLSPTQSAIRTQMLQPVYALAPPDRQVVNRG